MATDCPSNSTECLLRALIATTATQSSAWEPRSFGFTVAIGVAAFVISFVAIFQGLLAAGPGRIKASPAALGVFSKYSKGYVSWREFAWRSRAYAPTITFEDLVRNLVQQHQNVNYGTAFFEKFDGESTGATWLTLLKCVGLDEDIEKLFEKRLQPCATDHLPADVQAPPAAIQMSCLAVLAAIADPSTKIGKSSSERFPIVTGNISQVSFREHPVLGTLAAYERYHTQKPDSHYLIEGYEITPPYASLGRCTRFALELAEGSILLRWPRMEGYPMELPKYFSIKGSWGGCQSYMFDQKQAYCLRDEPLPADLAIAAAFAFAQTDYEVRPFPWRMAGLAMPASKLYACLPGRYRLEKTLDKQCILECLTTCGFVAGKNESSIESAITFKARGSWIVPYDGEKLKRGLNDPEDLAESIVESLLPLANGFVHDQSAQNMFPHEQKNRDVTNYSWENVSEICYTLEHIDMFLASNRSRGIEALNRLTTYLRQSTTTARLSIASTKSADSSTSLPINNSTAVIQGPQQPVLSQANRATASSSSTTFVSAHSGGNRSTQPVRTSETSATSTAVPDTRSEAMEALVTIRGLLFAVCLATGTDTSLLWSADFKNSFVRVI